MEKIMNINEIIYRGKVIDQGVIIGKRQAHWMLKKKYSPCYAMMDKNFISILTPHRKDFQIYIPRAYLEPGKQLVIINHEYQQSQISSIFKILEVESNYCKLEIIQESIKETVRPIIQASTTDLEEIVF